MSSKYIKKYPIPKEFPEILAQFIKEILRNQPRDIIDFGIEFFRCVEEKVILDYANRGQNIPCDFKPKIPTISKREPRVVLSPEEYRKFQESVSQGLKSINNKEDNILNRAFDGKITDKINDIPLDDKSIKRYNSDDSHKLMEGGGEIIEPDDTRSIMEGGGVMIDNEEESNDYEFGRKDSKERKIIYQGKEDEEMELNNEKQEELISKSPKESKRSSISIMKGGGELIEPDDTKSIMKGGGEIIEPDDSKSIMEGGGVMIDDEENDNISIMKGGCVMIGDEESDNISIMKGGGVMIGDEESDNISIMKGGGEIIEPNDSISIMKGGGVMVDDEEVDENLEKKLLATGSNIGEIKESTPPVTLTDFRIDNYEDCIDFNEKEEQLNKLKDTNNEGAIKYIDNVFIPNKNLNDILIEMQETLMSYYKNKGTENESEYIKLNEDLNNKLLEVKLQILENDPKTQSLNDAIADFKSYDYYPRAIRCYSMKLNEPSEENNVYLDEFCFFLFNHKLLKIVDEDDPKILDKYPYVKKYFIHNIELLQPEIYSFVLNSKYYPMDEFCNNFSSFSVRKRELCQNFYKLIYLGQNSKEINQCLNNMENCHYISSPKQIYAKLSQVNDDNKDEIEITVTEKLQSNYKKMWDFISRVINTPIELIEQSYFDFMSYKPIERNIIIDYLSLNYDYHEIHDKLASVEIDPDDSNFYHRMKELYMELTHCPELDYRNMCIYRNKLFDIPEKTKEYIDKFDDKNISLNDDELFKEYQKMSPLSQDGVYYYLLIKSKEDDRLGNLNKLIKTEKEKREANGFKHRGQNLQENFTLDSDEFVAFNKDYLLWKDNCAPEIKEFFNIDDNEKDNYFKEKLNEKEQKVIYDMLEIENILDEEYPLRDKLDIYSNIVGVESNRNENGEEDYKEKEEVEENKVEEEKKEEKKKRRKKEGNEEGLESDTDNENFLHEEEVDQ